MTYPTPNGAINPFTSYTDPDTVSYIASTLPGAQKTAFTQYYQNALAKDPSISPIDAYSAWAVGGSLAAGLGAAAEVVTGIPGDIGATLSTTGAPGVASAGSGSALLTIALELGAVGLFTIIADSSDQAASIMLIVMTGLWIMWAIQNSGVIAGFTNVITNIGGAA